MKALDLSSFLSSGCLLTAALSGALVRASLGILWMDGNHLLYHTQLDTTQTHNRPSWLPRPRLSLTRPDAVHQYIIKRSRRLPRPCSSDC